MWVLRPLLLAASGKLLPRTLVLLRLPSARLANVDGPAPIWGSLFETIDVSTLF